MQLRLARHNEGWTKSTKSGMPWQLCYVKSYETTTEAFKAEKCIKRQKSRELLLSLIASKANEYTAGS
jgi:putative endonuclease